MFSLESIRRMNARKDRANAKARARRAAARANETPEALEARLSAFERDERAAPWVECFDERENPVKSDITVINRPTTYLA